MSLRPVGNLPPSVYWRRRTLVVLPLLFLVILTFYVACSPSGGKNDAGASSPVASTSSVGSTPSGSVSASASPTTTGSGSPTTATTTPPASPSTTPTAAATAVAPCVATSLQVAAVTSAKSYEVGSEPVVSLQVTNTGLKPCSQDLADSQIVLTVYNGDARVWGSHDCKVEPGTNVSTLSPNRPVKLSITWTGLSSEPGCAAQRVRVAAGTYTLKATLGKITGVPATFSLT